MKCNDNRTEEDEFKAIELNLRRAFGDLDPPLPLIGDIHNLRFVLGRLLSKIEESLFCRQDEQEPEVLATKIFGVELMLQDDIPMILRDLLPALKGLRERFDDQD